MKAIVTNDKDRGIGLRILSEGANDLVLMEMLEEKYPAIVRLKSNGHEMRLEVPLEIHKSAGINGSMHMTGGVETTPFVRGEYYAITARNESGEFIQNPVICVENPTDFVIYAVSVNGRLDDRVPFENNRPSNDPKVSITSIDQSIPPGGIVELEVACVQNKFAKEGDGVFRCHIRSSSVSPSD